jgi:hypothetical protein
MVASVAISTGSITNIDKAKGRVFCEQIKVKALDSSLFNFFNLQNKIQEPINIICNKITAKSKRAILEVVNLLKLSLPAATVQKAIK